MAPLPLNSHSCRHCLRITVNIGALELDGVRAVPVMNVSEFREAYGDGCTFGRLVMDDVWVWNDDNDTSSEAGLTLREMLSTTSRYDACLVYFQCQAGRPGSKEAGFH